MGFVRSASLKLAALCRLRNGSVQVARTGRAPTPRLRLYEYEASPYCRRVRETLNVLGLRCLILPCPRETLRAEGAYSARSRFRDEVKEHGGRLLFPYLVDDTAGVKLNESKAIVEHLWKHYGADSSRPWSDRVLNGGHLPRPLDFALLAAPSGLRPWPECGLLAASASEPASEPLVLHGNEADEGTRLVRELMCELMIPYYYEPSESHPHRALPHLEDPGTQFKCFGARMARAYLNERYRRGPALSLTAHVTECENLGDRDRTSWLTHALRFLPGK